MQAYNLRAVNWILALVAPDSFFSGFWIHTLRRVWFCHMKGFFVNGGGRDAGRKELLCCWHVIYYCAWVHQSRHWMYKICKINSLHAMFSLMISIVVLGSSQWGFVTKVLKAVGAKERQSNKRPWICFLSVCTSGGYKMKLFWWMNQWRVPKGFWLLNSSERICLLSVQFSCQRAISGVV